MPSINMKTQCCIQEKNNVPVCQKSCTISKNSLSRTTNLQKVEAVETLIQSNQNASLCQVNDEAKIDNEEDPKENSSIDISISSVSFVCTDTGLNELNVPQLETDDSECSGSSCKYENKTLPDSCFLNMLESDLSIEGPSIYDDTIIDPEFFTDFQCDDESSLFFNMSNEFNPIPFLNDTINQNHDNLQNTLIASVDKSQVNNNNQVTSYSHQNDGFDPHLFLTNLPDSPVRVRNSKSVTLVLDLDETLIHSTLDPCEDADFTFPVSFNEKDHTVYVKQRPHLHEFLNRVADMFEIVIFTASQSIYAKQLLDILDPQGKLISKRIYRESCVFSETGFYYKDLTILGIDLAKVFIIDNSPQVFQLQVNNGIPIISWFDDPTDHELISLLPFLERLAEAEDVRPIIAEKFGNKE